MARTLNNRANAISAMSAHLEENHLDSAIVDYDETIGIYKRLGYRTRGEPHCAPNWPVSWTIAEWLGGHKPGPSNPARDHDQAIDIYEQLVEVKGRTPLGPEYIGCLINRSFTRHEQYKEAGLHMLQTAVRDLEKALGLQSALSADAERTTHLRELLTELEALHRNAEAPEEPRDAGSRQ